jgi:hypothetical protein
MTVLLVQGSELSRMGQRLASESTEILIFANFGVVDKTLTTNPLQQSFGLNRGWKRPKSVANLHAVIIYGLSI